MLAIVVAGAGCARPPDSGETTAAVSYYFQEISTPLTTMFVSAQMIEACVRRFPDKCSSWEGVDAHLARKVIDYVRLVSDSDLEELPRDVESGDLDEQIRRLLEQRNRFFEEAKSSELGLFARLEAVNKVCPDEKSAKRRSALEFGMDLNFGRFWRQSASDFADTRAAFLRQVLLEEGRIRSEWSKDQCAVAVEVGRDVLAQLLKKTRPLVENGALEFADRDRWTLTYLMFWRIGLGLKSEIDPGIEEKVEKIERR